MKALVTGSTGQDGYLVAKYLHRAGVQVFGIQRPQVDSRRNPFLAESHEIDLTDFDNVSRLIANLQPDIIVNLAAMADSWGQFNNPWRLIEVNTTAVVNILETLHKEGLECRFYQASSSEIYAGGHESPQSLRTPTVARTLYGVSKLSADAAVMVYREHYGLSCFRIVLFSHESPLRKQGFFSRKVVERALDVAEGKVETIVVYTPSSVRDWGYAGEYCRRIASFLAAGREQDVVLGSGTVHTVRQFVEEVCRQLGLDYDQVVSEQAEIPGRAREAICVQADSSAPEFMGQNLAYPLPRLIELLIRYAKWKRRNER